MFKTALTRSARSVRMPTLSAGRRWLATEAKAADPVQKAGDPNNKLLLTFAMPHANHFKKVAVDHVNLTASSGAMGIYANHVPTILQLAPGLIEVVPSSGPSQKFFASGGMAAINPDSTMAINATEAVAVEDLDKEAIRNQLSSAQSRLVSAKTDEEKALIQIELDVYQAASQLTL